MSVTVPLSSGKLFTRLFRLEYFGGLCIGALATLLMWYRPWDHLDLVVILCTGFYTALLYFSGFLANAVGDCELDVHYGDFKREIAQAVVMVGKRKLLGWMWAMIAVGLAFGVALCLLIASWVPLWAGGLGILAGTGYSLEPLRWKVRGFLFHFLSISYAVFFLPVFIFAGVLQREFSLLILLIACGYALAHYALEIGNQLKDFDFDRQMGIFTLPSSSPRLSCLTGLLMLCLGLGLELAGLAAYFSLAWPVVWLLSLIALLTHGRALALYARGIVSPQVSLAPFKNLRYATWQAFGMVGYLLMALIIRFR